MSLKARNLPARADRDQETGAILVLFALLFSGILGMLGAVVDGGRLRVTRQQMDAGAECAALEGVRFKDVDGDAARRARAIQATSYLFDDDLDPVGGDAMGLGAGSLPVVFGAEPLQGKLIVATDPGARVWKPADSLEANANNSKHGDLVAGSYVSAGSPTEDDAFTRGDFNPASSGSASTTLAAAPSFLVRLRRASDRLALDRQAGESSAGPPFEWLWARGAVWHEPTPGQTNASRADGVTVRSAAIASAKSALLVSADPVQSINVASFALRIDGAASWQTTAPGASLTLSVDPSGLLLSGGLEQGVVLAAPAQLVGAAVAVATGPLSNPVATPLILPVYGTDGGVKRVVGFTFALSTLAGTTLTVTRLASAVLPAGATRTSPAALDARLALDASPALRTLHASIFEPLLAPVLRR